MHLNLSLNQINDKSGMKFIKDLMLNKNITFLDMSGNQLSYQVNNTTKQKLVCAQTRRTAFGTELHPQDPQHRQQPVHG